MANVTELVIKLQGQDAASGVFASVKKEAGGLGKALGDVSKIAGGFVLGQGILQAPGFLMGAAQAAADDAASVAKLQQAVENSGASWTTYKGVLDGVISTAQRRGFSDDQARDSLSLLTAQTGSVEEATKRFAMAQDLARGTGIDVVTASRLLGKVNEENVNVLARYGIKVKEGATETELFGAIQQKFGGQAETFAKSTAGQMEAAKIQMGELKEKIGYAILPVLTAMTKLVAEDLVPAISNFVDLAGPKIKAVVVPTFETLKTVFGFLAAHKNETIAALAGIATTITVAMIPAVVAWTVAEWAKVTALVAATVAFVAANAPLVAIGLAIGAVVAGIVLLIQHWDDVTAAFKRLPEMLSEAWGWVTGFFTETVPNWIKENWPQILIGVFTGIPGLVLFHFRDKLWEIAQTDVLPFFTSTVPTWIKDNWPAILVTALTGIPGLVLWQFRDTLWEVFQSDVQPLFTSTIPTWFTDNWVPIVVGVLTGGAGTMIYAFRDEIAAKATEIGGNLLSAGGEMGNALMSGFVNGVKGLATGIGEIFTGTIDVAKEVANAILKAINEAIAKINELIPDEIGFSIMGKGFNFNLPDNPVPTIPLLARGGIVTRPTLALLAERGYPEAVIPLERGSRALAPGPTYNYNYTINFDGPFLGDIMARQKFADWMAQQGFLRREEIR